MPGNGESPQTLRRPIPAVVAVAAGAIAFAALFLHLGHGADRGDAGEAERDGTSIRDALSVRAADDAKLVTWDEVATVKLPFDKPTCLAVTEAGMLYAGGDESVKVISPKTGQASETIALPGAPTALALAPQMGEGAFLVSVGAQVYLRKTGRAPELWLDSTTQGKSLITGIAADTESVWLADSAARAIWRADLQGQVTATIGRRDDAREILGLVAPSPFLDVVARGDGSVLANNPGRHRVETYGADGALSGFWGKGSAETAGFCGCCNPLRIELLPDGRIVTSEKGIPRIKAYTSEGELDGVVASSRDLSRHAEGLDLAVDKAGRIYALDIPARLVRVYQERPAAPDK